MRSDSGEQSSQWSDVTEAIASRGNGCSRKKQSMYLRDPFSDPRHEDKVIQLRSFEALNASRSEPCPEDFVLEHPSRKLRSARRSQTDGYLTSALHGERKEDNEEREQESTDFAMDTATQASSIVSSLAELPPSRQTPMQNTATALSSQQRRSTLVPPSSYNMDMDEFTPRAAKLITLQRVDAGCVRTSSIYEDDMGFRHADATYNYNYTCDPIGSTRASAPKRRPATLGFEAYGELKHSNSKSSSRASVDPFRFDGERYSPFLKPSAERDVSRALYQDDSKLTGIATEGTAQIQASFHSQSQKVEDAVKVPVRNHAALPAATEEHPISLQLDLRDVLVEEDLAGMQRQHDIDDDWQTVTTEQTRPHRALELTLRLDREVGSSLADVSSAPDDEFDQFIGAANRESQFISAQNYPPLQRALGTNVAANHPTSGAHDTSKILGPTDRSFRQSYQKHHRRPARAAAAIRHLSRRLSPDLLKAQMRYPSPSYESLGSDISKDYSQTGPQNPHTGFHDHDAGHQGGQDSPPYRSDHWPVSTLRLDPQEILGHGTHPANNHSSPGHAPRPLAAAAAAAAATTTGSSLPRFPFPLISLPEAAALQSQRRERGEEDHSDPGPAFAAKARSCTVSTVSSNGPYTPSSPARGSCWLGKPKQTYRPPHQAHTLQPQRSSDLLRQEPQGSYFQASVPKSISLLSARFFRLSNLSTRARDRGVQHLRPVPSAQQRYFHHHSFFTQSQTDLIRSAREDILFRRRHHSEDDPPQRLIFTVILVLTIAFPLIGLLALWGKFDGTIAWYARGERGCLTGEQRATLKQQLLVEVVLYPALIIALSVYYSVHG
ncbi:hypothetical protein E4U09_004037 [Claviceps aff. purpurea]|uniref:Uncharacterized protein n=1 Tax=Claviceps aff. purpurea TaxID=1967640 RepID=A0A9P7QDW6_9HYPO|nr:hypothetical protein E4U09_004037 [Claviceps aff. purpurea]